VASSRTSSLRVDALALSDLAGGCDGVGYLDDRPECRFGDSRSPVGLAGSPALPGLYFIQQDS